MHSEEGALDLGGRTRAGRGRGRGGASVICGAPRGRTWVCAYEEDDGARFVVQVEVVVALGRALGGGRGYGAASNGCPAHAWGQLGTPAGAAGAAGATHLALSASEPIVVQAGGWSRGSPPPPASVASRCRCCCSTRGR